MTLAMWAFVRKFWPFGIIIVLVFVLLFMRNTILDRTSKLDAANVRVTDLTDANKANAALLQTMAQARVDNDAIADAVAAKIGAHTIRETNTRTIIEKAKANDPQVRTWADTPVPDSVREGLRAH